MDWEEHGDACCEQLCILLFTSGKQPFDERDGVEGGEDDEPASGSKKHALEIVDISSSLVLDNFVSSVT